MSKSGECAGILSLYFDHLETLLNCTSPNINVIPNFGTFLLPT
jgi:hypothetical protein